ncbi:unnamed protein product [Rotaria sp. Silwood1]|nr:unnamed protein product [Rotaria sp. Silwood1]
MSITSIENFSNEVFNEIFEYLDGCEIYKAFSNLNYRFQQLLYSSSLLYKINLHRTTSNELYLNIYKQLLLNHKHQILAFHIWSPLQKSEFFSSFSIDASFNRLESIVINELPSAILISLLTNLSSLPRLFSLTIDARWALRDLSEVYRLIFTLSKLKYIKCSAESTTISNSLPIATNEQFSTIEYFIINHDCGFNELCTLISYTPQLCHLNLMNLSKSHSNNEIILPVSFSNLTYLSIEMAYITFDELEMFIIETECNLKVLRIITFFADQNYLDGDRWEELISNYLLELEEFYLEYYQDIDPESGSLTDFEPPNQFNSSFWIERKWVLEVEMDSFAYIYSIRSYKERWYDVNSSIELSNSTRLILTDLPHDEYIMILNLIIRDLLAMTQIYHLEISKKTIYSDILIEIIYKLSALDTLKITSLILSQSRCLFIENKNLRLVSNKNNIKKVYLEKMLTMEEVYFLIRLCPRMTYLKIDFINDMNIELFVKDILKKINNDCNQYLRSLCIHNPTADDDIIQKLEEMINREKLLHHFTIKCIADNIYLQWK